jgi:type II secretory pathway component PulF
MFKHFYSVLKIIYIPIFTVCYFHTEIKAFIALRIWVIPRFISIFKHFEKQKIKPTQTYMMDARSRNIKATGGAGCSYWQANQNWD